MFECILAHLAGISANVSYTESHKVTVSSDFMIPGWTKKGMRPYIRFKKEYVKAKVKISVPTLDGGFIVEEWVYSPNVIVTEEGVKYKEYVNDTGKYSSYVPVFPGDWEE